MSAPEPTVPPVKSTEEYFNSSRLKVIGMITAATVAVGALGGVAGVVFDEDQVPLTPQVETEGGGLGSAGEATPRLSRGLPFLHVSADETPSPVGSVSPGTGGFSPSPTDEPEPTEEPTPSPDGGGGVTMTATGVDVYVPPGWEVVFSDDNEVAQTNGQGSYAYAISDVLDPSVSAGDIIAGSLEGLLPAENYTQLQTSEIQPIEVAGSVVSAAVIVYDAIWVDNQGSLSLHGEMYVAVRQDGTVIVMLLEHLPAEGFDDAIADLAAILGNTFRLFAGLG